MDLLDMRESRGSAGPPGANFNFGDGTQEINFVLNLP